jgi:ketosteroid isomerase-like protein
MSEENVELVRRLYASLTRADDGWRELVAPDFVIDFSRRRVDPFVARGRDDQVLASLQKETLEVWEEPPTWEPEELIDAGDKVFAFIRTRARGKGSGVEVEARVANVWTFRGGTPVEFTYFGEDRAAALEAAGLSE